MNEGKLLRRAFDEMLNVIGGDVGRLGAGVVQGPDALRPAQPAPAIPVVGESPSGPKR